MTHSPKLMSSWECLNSTNFDWAGAEKEIKRALELDPNSFEANRRIPHYLATVGRADEALVPMRNGLQELDPDA